MRFWVLICCVSIFGACILQADATQDKQLEKRIRAHVEFLADDLLRGREPGSAGYDIAANYVASQFLQTGLTPAGSDGGYFQQVPLRRALLQPGSARLNITQGQKTRELVFVEEFFMSPSLGRTVSSVEAGLVFAGYGIEASELGHNDYAGLDVTGRIVVLFAGQPHDFPSEEGAHFASSKEKARAAARHGAVGLLVIHTPRAAARSAWDRMRNRVGKPAMGWINEEDVVHGFISQLQATAILSHTAAADIFTDAPYDLAALIELDEIAQRLPVFKLDGEAIMSQRSTHEALHSPNVAAVLPGSDPLLAGEYVIYTAHLDHIGELIRAKNEVHDHTGQGQALINNGALDNASGVSVMLETARLFADGAPPRRSILFVAVTGEEKGLVGSEYFATNPTVPIDKIIAAINLDMPLLLYDFADVIAFGSRHSSMGETVAGVVREFGVELTPDPYPEQNIFVRSDHYRFVQQGVPSIYLVTGVKSRDEVIDTQPIFEAFLQQHYHKPSDDLSLPIRYDAAARFTLINARIGEKIADDTKRPRWHEGDFFGRTFSN